jgi:hypothetical protein
MKTLLLIQSTYFFITGIWPLFHIKSFVKVTGPKHDIWLVKTVGALITCIALSLFSATFFEIMDGTVVLATTTAFALLLIDVYYNSIGRISSVYLLDAMLQLFLLAAWVVVITL